MPRACYHSSTSSSFLHDLKLACGGSTDNHAYPVATCCLRPARSSSYTFLTFLIPLSSTQKLLSQWALLCFTRFSAKIPSTSRSQHYKPRFLMSFFFCFLSVVSLQTKKNEPSCKIFKNSHYCKMMLFFGFATTFISVSLLSLRGSSTKFIFEICAQQTKCGNL
ncbi:unnamed protein product [Amoebophrya sp. A120]|nr:unnamed protein product [Amoebophrya sp. A120]|eukprot:GSA120T00010238001.1